MNHEEFFKSLISNGCSECENKEDFSVQRRIEEQINYDEYWGIEDGEFQLNSQEDFSKEKRVIWYIVKCEECENEVKVDDIDLLIEFSNDWDNSDVKEESFFKEVEAQ
jgi:hypothetical protein